MMYAPRCFMYPGSAREYKHIKPRVIKDSSAVDLCPLCCVTLRKINTDQELMQPPSHLLTALYKYCLIFFFQNFLINVINNAFFL